jgi:hypothetical protein
MTRVRIPDFGGADYDDDDGADDAYSPDDEESPEKCSLCNEDPPAASAEYYGGRLAVCPHCALGLIALATGAVAAGALDEGGAEEELGRAFRQMVEAYWRAVGRPCPSLAEWLQRWLKSRGGPKEGGGP